MKTIMFAYERSNKGWSLQMKTLLFQNGLGYAWESQDRIFMNTEDTQLFQTKFKRRLEDIEIQTWRSSPFDDDSRPGFKASWEKQIKNIQTI